MSTFFIGVDGGGTKTKAVLIDELGNMVGSAIGGSTNIQAVGGESLQKEMFSILNRLIGNAKKDAGDIRYIVMGLAGAGRNGRRQLHHRAARCDRPAERHAAEEAGRNTLPHTLHDSRRARSNGSRRLSTAGDVRFRRGADRL